MINARKCLIQSPSRCGKCLYRSSVRRVKAQSCGFGCTICDRSEMTDLQSHSPKMSSQEDWQTGALTVHCSHQQDCAGVIRSRRLEAANGFLCLQSGFDKLAGWTSFNLSFPPQLQSKGRPTAQRQRAQ